MKLTIFSISLKMFFLFCDIDSPTPEHRNLEVSAISLQVEML